MQKASLGLSARAIIFGLVRAEEDPVNPGSLLTQQLIHSCVDLVEPVETDDASADCGLVGYHQQEESGFAHPAQALGCSGQKRDMIRVGEVVPLDDDRAISVNRGESAFHVIFPGFCHGSDPVSHRSFHASEVINPGHKKCDDDGKGDKNHVDRRCLVA